MEEALCRLAVSAFRLSLARIMAWHGPTGLHFLLGLRLLRLSRVEACRHLVCSGRFYSVGFGNFDVVSDSVMRLNLVAVMEFGVVGCLFVGGFDRTESGTLRGGWMDGRMDGWMGWDECNRFR